MITLPELQSVYQELNREDTVDLVTFYNLSRQYIRQNLNLATENLANLLTAALLQTTINHYRQDGNNLSEEEIERHFKEEMIENIENIRSQTPRLRNRVP